MKKPCFCIWASDDTIIAQNFPLIITHFKEEEKRVLVDAGKILDSSIPKKESFRSHLPELERSDLFKQKFSEFLKILFPQSNI